MDVHYNEDVTAAERADIDAWVHMHDLDDIDTVVVGTSVVAVHAQVNAAGLTGTSQRHGNVVAELNAALGMLRKIRDNI
jgi:hypothetical protein